MISIIIYYQWSVQCNNPSCRKMIKNINVYNSKWHEIVFFSANAVQAMVSKDIVHRDLKPQNILMNHEGRSVKNPQPQDIRLKIGK